MASMTEELHFESYSILINLNENRHRRLAATELDSTGIVSAQGK